MDYHFKPASDGQVPPGAQPHGREGDGTQLFVARSPGNTIPNPIRGIHPGKVRPGFGGAFIPLGGKEVLVKAYEVLVEAGTWIAGSNGQIPDGAIVCGREESGEPLFVARADFNGGVHPGKIRFDFRGAFISFNGKEVLVPNYEVLVSQNGLR